MGQAGKTTKRIFDGRYEILGIVGRGSRSVVYHARHALVPSSEVALKVLLQKKETSSLGEKLRKEALAMVSSRHKYVVRLDDFHSVGDLCYLSMEFAPERDLRVYAEKFGGKLGPKQVELFLSQAAEALNFIHKAGIIHRDLKPENILVVSDKELRIADFGVALLPGEQSSIQELQAAVGTLDYMAPEVLEGRDFSQAADVYALGVCFYQILSGEHPFQQANMAQQIEARRDHNVTSLSSLIPGAPDYLSDTIMRCIKFDQEQRINSAQELIHALSIGKDQQTADRTPKSMTAKEPAPKDSAPSTPKSVQNGSSASKDTQAAKGKDQQSAKTSELSESAKSLFDELRAFKDEPPSPPSDVAPAKSKVPADAKIPADDSLDTDTTPHKSIDTDKSTDSNTGKKTEKKTDQKKIDKEHESTGPTDSSIGKKLTTAKSSSQPPANEHDPVVDDLEIEDDDLYGDALDDLLDDPLDDDVEDIFAWLDEQEELAKQAELETKEQAEEPDKVAAIETPAAAQAETDDAEAQQHISSIRSASPSQADTEQSTVRKATTYIDHEDVSAAVQAAQSETEQAIDKLDQPEDHIPTSDQQEYQDPAPRMQIQITDVDRPRRNILPYAVVALLVVFGWYFMSGSKDNVDEQMADSLGTDATDVVTMDGANSPIPPVAAGELPFPMLPSGMYQGTITNLIPGEIAPFALISLSEESKLIVLIGLEGWTPAIVATDELERGARIKVAANGLLLELTGTEIDGELVGYFRNVMNDAQGKWSASPVRAAAEGDGL